MRRADASGSGVNMQRGAVLAPGEGRCLLRTFNLLRDLRVLQKKKAWAG